jgi:hypothetical protein
MLQAALVAVLMLAGLAAAFIVTVPPAGEVGRGTATKSQPQGEAAAARESSRPPAGSLAPVPHVAVTVARPVEPVPSEATFLPVVAAPQLPPIPLPDTRGAPGGGIPGSPLEIIKPPPPKASLRPPEPVRPSRSEGQMVTTTGANVRAAPDSAAPVLREVPSGARLQVHARMGGWLQVGDAQVPWGWIHGSRAAGGSPSPGASWRVERAPLHAPP